MNALLKHLRIVLIVVTALLFMLACTLYGAYFWLNNSVQVPDEHRVHIISKGQSLYGLADDLSRKGLLKFPRLWVYYALFFDNANINAGEYALDIEESPLSLLEKFKSTKVIQYKLTLVEGTSARNALSVLREQEKLTKRLPDTISVENPGQLNLDVDHLEGWLYPDTYYYSAGDSDYALLQRAHAKMRSVLAEEWSQRQVNLPLHSAYEALILASIVERETGAPHERAEIAGVFIRRLQKGMRLQTDPTVIYGMGESYKGNITRADLRRPTAYNTYTIKGLPPTPIALPGRAAIHAVLNPKEGDTLYFVAKGDGTHYFSKTLEEHQNAVKKYQLSRKKNYRSNYTEQGNK